MIGSISFENPYALRKFGNKNTPKEKPLLQMFTENGLSEFMTIN